MAHITVPSTKFKGDPTTINFLSSNVTGDAGNNLYVVWVDDSDLNPRLAYSEDRGATWSAPIMIGSPGREGVFVRQRVGEKARLRGDRLLREPASRGLRQRPHGERQSAPTTPISP